MKITEGAPIADLIYDARTDLESQRNRSPSIPDELWVERMTDFAAEDKLRIELTLQACRSKSEEVVLEKFNMPMTKRLMNSLNDNLWLNDEIVNMFIQLLQERDSMLCKSNYRRRPSHYFSSFFVNKLMDCGNNEYNYSNVQR